jgi:trigger factor
MNYVAGNLVETYRQTADMYGMDFSLFLETYLQTDLESFTRQVETAAKQTLAEEMILKAIAEKENITVSDEEFEQGCERYAAQYGYDSADALKQAFDEPTIRISLLMDKTFEFLEGAADIQLIIETETETENGPETETGM